jgi:hypothetical protein
MKNKTFEPKTDTQRNLSPYQAERGEAQRAPGLRPDPLGATLASPGSEATVRAHAAGLNRATARPALRRLQRQHGNRYVQRVVERVQRQGGAEGFELDDEMAGRIHRARSGGQPLNGAVQAQMSGALGYDFSGVRVHTDSEADALNQQLNARAFTIGQDIFFRRGEYSLGVGSGWKVIAHELTHVVQQMQGRIGSTTQARGVAVDGDVELEHQADMMEERATYAGGVIQRMVAVPTETGNVEDVEDWIVVAGITYALRRAGGPVVDFGHADFSRMAPEEELIILQHGQPGQVGQLNADDIVTKLVTHPEAIPPNISTVTFMSCFAGADVPGGPANSSLVDSARAGLVAYGYDEVLVSGAEGPAIADIPGVLGAGPGLPAPPLHVVQPQMVQLAALAQQFFLEQHQDGILQAIAVINSNPNLAMEEKAEIVSQFAQRFYTDFVNWLRGADLLSPPDLLIRLR